MLFSFFGMGCTPKTLEIPPPPPIHVEKAQTNNSAQQALVLTAWYHTHRKEWNEAERLFAKAVETHPHDVWLYIHWGDAAYRMGEWNTASKVWTQALEELLPSDIETKLHIIERLERQHL